MALPAESLKNIRMARLGQSNGPPSPVSYLPPGASEGMFRTGQLTSHLPESRPLIAGGKGISAAGDSTVSFDIVHNGVKLIWPLKLVPNHRCGGLAPAAPGK